MDARFERFHLLAKAGQLGFVVIAFLAMVEFRSELAEPDPVLTDVCRRQALLKTNARGRFVDEVDRLIGQAPVPKCSAD